MRVSETHIPDVCVIEPDVYGDERGFFLESYNRRGLAEVAGIDVEFVQDNHSKSARNVLRGLHYQVENIQGKLVRVIAGEIFDVAVDLRRGSNSFGKWTGQLLSTDNHKMLWVPPFFAHGFVVMSETAEVLYKTTDYYAPEHERAIIWNDPDLAIDWPFKGHPRLSEKDRAAPFFRDAPGFP